METKKIDEYSVIELTKKYMQNHIRLCEILIEELSVPNPDYQKAAQECSYIILKHMDEAMKHLHDTAILPVH